MLCHGGPIATPEDAQYILDNCPDCHGFYGASYTVIEIPPVDFLAGDLNTLIAKLV